MFYSKALFILYSIHSTFQYLFSHEIEIILWDLRGNFSILYHVRYLCINTSMHMTIKPGEAYTYLYTVSATCDIIIFFMQVQNFKCVKFVIPYSIRYQMKKLYLYMKISYVHCYLSTDW